MVLDMDVGGGTAPMELGQEEHPCQERTKQQAERQARRDILREARKPLMELPADEWFEIPGRYACWACSHRSGTRAVWWLLGV